MDTKIHVGIAGWSYADWEGIVYAESVKDKLEYVSGFVDVIEINNTFYRPPAEKYTESWFQRTSAKPDFFFTAKLHRDFTHEGKIEQATVKQFHSGFKPLLDKGKLKQLLAQFRFDFDDTAPNREHLSEIVKNFSDSFSLVVEVRHKSWQAAKALDFLQELGVTVCNLDYPTGRNSFDMKLCTIGKIGYFRMHGRNAEKWFSKAGRDETYNYYYDDSELGEIKNRLDKLAAAFESLTVIANNHYRGAELANALELKALISGEKQVVPEGLLRSYPDLARIAVNA
ncbi:MAG: DUF72 domain-containing protein [Planctomycetota bacterium]|jgi:uncharacterized protein YecE (DUF72 family)